MAFKWRELEAMDDEELIAATTTLRSTPSSEPRTTEMNSSTVGRCAAQAQWEQAEEARCLNERIATLTESIRRLTVWLVVLTVALLAATVVAVAITAGRWNADIISDIAGILSSSRRSRSGWMGRDPRSSQPSRSTSTGSSTPAHGFACRTREPWATGSSSFGSTSIAKPSASPTSSRVSDASCCSRSSGSSA